jgi:DNA polymerase-3 subunit delta'
MTQLSAAADAGRLGHAWLLSGPRGLGKANLAYALAGRLLSLSRGPLPVAGPRAIVAAYAELAQPVDLHADLHRVRIRVEDDKHTIAVEQIRDMTSELVLTAHRGGAKVVVIETADMMTIEAANALLKSLEEPTPDTFLLLLAERAGRLPATIRSRCQHLALRGPGVAEVRKWLAGDNIDPGGLAPAMLQRRPIVAASLAIDKDKISYYNELQNNIHLLLEGRYSPYELAEAWSRDDPEFALSCLIERLRGVIRSRLVPSHSNLVTDQNARLTDNSTRRIALGALFAGLQMAENLRDQLGRGANIELALKSILAVLDRGDDRRLKA